MTNIFEKHLALVVTIVLLLSSQLSFAQYGTPYDGIDSVNGVAWRFSHGLSRTDPNWGIRREYSTNQSDYLVVSSCHDSSNIYTFPCLS